MRRLKTRDALERSSPGRIQKPGAWRDDGQPKLARTHGNRLGPTSAPGTSGQSAASAAGGSWKHTNGLRCSPPPAPRRAGGSRAHAQLPKHHSHGRPCPHVLPLPLQLGPPACHGQMGPRAMAAVLPPAASTPWSGRSVHLRSRGMPSGPLSVCGRLLTKAHSRSHSGGDHRSRRRCMACLHRALTTERRTPCSSPTLMPSASNML